MISVDKLLRYLPKQHGEHGVDSTLHRLTLKQYSLHEVFSNTPGGSWAKFDIINPVSSEIYRWDHIPRVTSNAKRPDWVLQFDEESVMNFLLFESKQFFSQIYVNMEKELVQFVEGTTSGYLGLRNRPAWHKKPQNGKEWSFISPEEQDKIRFWFRDYDSNLIRFWPAFAFAFSPEYYEKLDSFDKHSIMTQFRNLLTLRPELKAIIGVGWTGEHQTPFIVRDYSVDFRTTKFASELDKLLGPVIFE